MNVTRDQLNALLTLYRDEIDALQLGLTHLDTIQREFGKDNVTYVCQPTRSKLMGTLRVPEVLGEQYTSGAADKDARHVHRRFGIEREEGWRGGCTFDSVQNGAIHLSSVYRSLAETEVYRARRSGHIRLARLIANKPLLQRPLPAPSLFSRYRIVSRSIASYATTSIASTFSRSFDENNEITWKLDYSVSYFCNRKKKGRAKKMRRKIIDHIKDNL